MHVRKSLYTSILKLCAGFQQCPKIVTEAYERKRREVREVIDRQMAAQELASAEAQRDQTLYQIERTRIVAPFDGVVAERMHQPGEFIAAGEPLVRLVNDTQLEVRAQAPISVLRYVNSGAKIAVETDFQESLASIRAIVPVGDERSRMVELRVTLPADRKSVV